MGADTKIEWADHTFNPWVGCTKVSPACDICYAEGWAKRTGHPELWKGERRRTTPANWRQPEKWNAEAPAKYGRPARVFCASLADVFDNQVPNAWRDDLFALIDRTPNLNWLLLTKRPQNIAKMLPEDWGTGYPNVWLGTTVEDQNEANRRIPILMNLPARVRFLSCEPLLGPLDLTRVHAIAHNAPVNVLAPMGCTQHAPGHCLGGCPWRWRAIDWIIAGGESGPGARPMHPNWARDLRDQCREAGVPFLFKQWGNWVESFDSEGTFVQKNVVAGDGKLTYAGYGETPATVLSNLGKMKAGRLLDGVEHNGFPA